MGFVEVEDQLVGFEYFKSLFYVDVDNIGIWGWFYGGYMMLMMILQVLGEYVVGIFGVLVIDWMFYDIVYIECYMDYFDVNFEGYEQFFVFVYLDGYEMLFFLIYGMVDDNVIFVNFVCLYGELQ